MKTPLLAGEPEDASSWPSPAVVARAAMHVENALDLREPTLNLPDANVPLVRRYYGPLRHYTALFLATALLCLAFVEPPTTMRSYGLETSALDVRSSATIELAICGLLLLDVRMQHRAVGADLFWQGTWRKLRVLALAQVGLNALFSLMWPETFRLQRFVRPLVFMSELREVQAIVGSVVASLPKLLRICVLLFFHIVFCGTFAYLLFNGVDQCGAVDLPDPYDPHPGGVCSPFSKNCVDYFRTMGQSIHHMFVLLTTANYPDVMLPAYDCHEVSALFFVYFILVGIVFLLNLVLAIVFSSFQASTLKKTVEYIALRNESLDAAFDTLTTLPTGEFVALDEHSFVELLLALRSDLSMEDRLLLFRVLDLAQTNYVTREQFRTLPHFVELNVVRAETLYEEGAGAYMRARLAVARLMDRSDVQLAFTMLVNLNGVMLIVEFAWTGDDSQAALFDALDSVLLALFTVEIVLKVFGYGWWKFWGEALNRVDFVAVGLGLVAQMALGDSSSFLRGAMGLRMIRLVRSLRTLKGFHVILKSTAQSLAPLTRYAAVAAMSFYIYAVLGMEVFAGLITGHADASPALQDSSYGLLHYWENNFNSMRSSLVVLFELMVVNNWPVTLEGYEAVTSDWARLYFYSWYFVIVTTVANIVTAFLIESIHARYEANNAIVEGKDPMWVVSVRHAAQSLGYTDFDDWVVTRRFNLLHTYERLYADEIQAQSSDAGIEEDVNAFSSKDEGFKKLERRRQSVLHLNKLNEQQQQASPFAPRRHASPSASTDSAASSLSPASRFRSLPVVQRTLGMAQRSTSTSSG